MKTHTKTFHIRLTEIEYERLCKYSKRAGLPKSTYIRFMINGQSPKDHIDYERFGRDVRLDECGTFAARGYIRNNGDPFHEYYDGMIVPEEYRVSGTPESDAAMKLIKNKYE